MTFRSALALLKTPYLVDDQLTYIRERWVYIFAGAIIFILAFAERSWDNILHPGFHMEDGSYYFPFFYDARREVGEILQNPNGYHNVLNNAVAWLGAFFDVRLQPLIYHCYGLLGGITIAICMSFSGLFKSPWVLCIAPLVLGMTGMNHIFYFNTLTFQMYNVVVLLLCLLLSPPVKSPVALVGLCLLCSLLVWSGPYSVVALPVCLALLFFYRNTYKSILLVWVAVNVVLYLATVTENTVMLENILQSGIQQLIAKVLFENVFYLELFGQQSNSKLVLFAAIMTSLFIVFRKNTDYIKISLILIGISIAALAPHLLSAKLLLYRLIFPVHLYISQFFWLCFLLFTLDQLIQKFRPAILLKVAIPLLAIALVVHDHKVHRGKGTVKIVSWPSVFVQTIHKVQQLDLEKENKFVFVTAADPDVIHIPPRIKVGSYSSDAKRVFVEFPEFPESKNYLSKKKDQ